MSAVYSGATGAQNVYCGVSPDIEQVKRTWRIGGHFPSAPGELLAGAEVARTGKWELGQQVELPGLKGRTGTVAGILRPTQGADDLFIYIPLTDAQKLFKRPGEVTHVLVRLDQPESMESVVTALRSCDAGLDMNVVPLAHLFHTIENLVQSTRLLLGCVALVALLAAGAGVSNTILMAVTERTREIGVLRAVGASRSDVFRIIWSETVLLCFIGGVSGVLLAIAGAGAVETWLRGRLPFSPRDVLVRPELSVIVFCLIATLVLGSLAGLLPAWRAGRLSPMQAIRS